MQGVIDRAVGGVGASGRRGARAVGGRVDCAGEGASPLGEAGNAEPVPEQAPDVPHGRVVMLLPPELIQDNEIIILLLKPSLWYVLLESARFLLAMTAVLLAAVWVYRQGYSLPFGPRDLAMLGIGLGTARVCWQFLEWLSRVYVLTDRRVIRVKGVIEVQVFETNLQQVQHTYTTFSFKERLFGLGSIGFTTAGTGHVDAAWVMLDRPLEIHQTLVRALNRYR